MKIKKILLAVVLLSTVSLSTSCTKNDIAEDEALFKNATEQQAIDGKEIKNQDT